MDLFSNEGSAGDTENSEMFFSGQWSEWLMYNKSRCDATCHEERLLVRYCMFDPTDLRGTPLCPGQRFKKYKMACLDGDCYPGWDLMKLETGINEKTARNVHVTSNSKIAPQFGKAMAGIYAVIVVVVVVYFIGSILKNTRKKQLERRASIIVKKKKKKKKDVEGHDNPAASETKD